jgi:hypothetical protein
VIHFDPGVGATQHPFHRDRVYTIAHAIEAIAQISGDAVVEEIEFGLGLGCGPGHSTGESDPPEDPLAVIRAFAVKALRHCSLANAEHAYRLAMQDPNTAISTLARDILEERRETV